MRTIGGGWSNLYIVLAVAVLIEGPRAAVSCAYRAKTTRTRMPNMRQWICSYAGRRSRTPQVHGPEGAHV